MIEYANGDARRTVWGRKRAEAGHPKPFNLKYIGIGNEDMITEVFEERFAMIYKAVREKHPEITNAKSRAGSREVMKMNNFWKAASRKRKMFFLFSALILAAVIALLSVLFSSLLIRPEKIRLKSDVSAVFADERYEYYGETDGKIERADESGVKTFADLGSKILLLEKLGENLAVATEDRKIT